MQSMHFVRMTAYIAGFFFLVTGIILLRHHHALSPKFTTCSTCNVKNSFIGTPDKNAKDCSLVIVSGYGCLPGKLPVILLIRAEAGLAPAHASSLADLNKSPPCSLS